MEVTCFPYIRNSWKLDVFRISIKEDLLRRILNSAYENEMKLHDFKIEISEFEESISCLQKHFNITCIFNSKWMLANGHLKDILFYLFDVHLRLNKSHIWIQFKNVPSELTQTILYGCDFRFPRNAKPDQFAQKLCE